MTHAAESTITTEIAVIGGGIFGCAIAWRLAAYERREVVLLERNELASGASARAAGLVLPLRADAGGRWIVAQTLAAFAALPEAGFRRVGVLHVAASAASETALQTLAGSGGEWISSSDAGRLVPWLDSHTATAMLLAPDGGYIDPYSATMAYANAARHAGATLRSRVAVLGLIRDGQAITGVRTSAGSIRARVVIVAAGAWSAPLVEPLGVSLPMAPVRSSYWISSRDPIFSPTQPVVMLPDAHSYARPETDRLLLGARENRSPTWDARLLPADMAALTMAQEDEQWDGLIERGPALRRFLPVLDHLGMAHYIAGLSTYTADGNLLLGPVRGLSGVIVATGCNGNGIGASGGIARIVADLVAGRSPEIDLSPYRPDRLGRFDAYAQAFRERCAGARLVKAGHARP